MPGPWSVHRSSLSYNGENDFRLRESYPCMFLNAYDMMCVNLEHPAAQVGGTNKEEYELTVPLFKAIDEENSKWAVGARGIVFILAKKEPEYWERLLPPRVKMNNCKVHGVKTPWSCALVGSFLLSHCHLHPNDLYALLSPVRWDNDTHLKLPTCDDGTER